MDALMALLLILPAVCGANDLASAARELSDSARAAGLSRLAVAPFDPLGGEDRAEGALLSESLTTELVRAGAVRVIERVRFGESPSEGIVAGDFGSSGEETWVYARLIDSRTGVILAAVERKIARHWI